MRTAWLPPSPSPKPQARDADGGTSRTSHFFVTGHGLAHEQLFEDGTEVDHRLAQVLGARASVRLGEQALRVPVPVDDLRIVGGDVRRLLLGVAVRRIPALCEHALDDSLGCARRITRIAHEECLGLAPLLQAALDRYPAKSANV